MLACSLKISPRKSRDQRKTHIWVSRDHVTWVVDILILYLFKEFYRVLRKDLWYFFVRGCIIILPNGLFIWHFKWRMNLCINEWMDGRKNKEMGEWLNRWMNERMKVKTEWIDILMHGRMNSFVWYNCVLIGRQ